MLKIDVMVRIQISTDHFFILSAKIINFSLIYRIKTPAKNIRSAKIYLTSGGKLFLRKRNPCLQL